MLGRTTVQEVGHYLGLRHIWGDGSDCTAEDGIDDTPHAIEQSNQDCDTTINACIDNIGVLGDLPNMVENYMDYSAETCQNAFTLGQVDMMRSILENYRFDLINNNPALVLHETANNQFSVYPNPSNGNFFVSGLPGNTTQILIYSESGQLLQSFETNETQTEITVSAAGIYFVSVITAETSEVKRLVVFG